MTKNRDGKDIWTYRLDTKFKTRLNAYLCKLKFSNPNGRNATRHEVSKILIPIADSPHIQEILAPLVKEYWKQQKKVS